MYQVHSHGMLISIFDKDFSNSTKDEYRIKQDEKHKDKLQNGNSRKFKK
jgi:hypothetical protein